MMLLMPASTKSLSLLASPNLLLPHLYIYIDLPRNPSLSPCICINLFSISPIFFSPSHLYALVNVCVLFQVKMECVALVPTVSLNSIDTT